MKAIKTLLTVHRVVFFTFVILYLLVALGPSVIGIRPNVVLSASMEPTIMTGSLVYVQKADTKALLAGMLKYKEPGEGDIVAFNQRTGDNAITVVHRIQSIDSEGNYTMKGDNNKSDDIATIKKDQIIGNFKWSIPYLGYFTTWLQSKKGLVIAITLALIAFVSSFIGDASDNKKARKKRNSSQRENVTHKTQ